VAWHRGEVIRKVIRRHIVGEVDTRAEVEQEAILNLANLGAT
jgi:hypothetical protein